jgi:hypothetical protein
MVRLEGLDKLKKIDFIGTRTRNLPACTIPPQPFTLLHTPKENIDLTSGTRPRVAVALSGD